MAQVLDLIGSVDLIDSMPALPETVATFPNQAELGVWDRAVIRAARVTHLEGTKGDEKDARLIEYLMSHAHTSPFEQVKMQWRVNAPLIVWWQWVRHRTFQYQSINSQSGRYTPFEEDKVYTPFNWRLQSKSNHQGSDGAVSFELGQEITDKVEEHYRDCFMLYNELLGHGVAKEQARLVLPGFAVYYMWLVSVDLHNAMQFWRLRLADDVQDEVYWYAATMFKIAFPYAPVTLIAFLKNALGLQLQPDKSRLNRWTTFWTNEGIARGYSRFRKFLEAM